MTKDEIIDRIAVEQMFIDAVSSPDTFDQVHPIRSENIYDGLMEAFRAGQEWQRNRTKGVSEDMQANLINDMSVNDLLSLYEDAVDLDYYEMQEAVRLTLKQRCGEHVSQEEYDACIQQWLDSGGTLRTCKKEDME